MPSPIGHLIAGGVIGQAFAPGDRRTIAICAALATAPDLDLLFPATHRMATHSLSAVVVVTILTVAVTARVTGIGYASGSRIRIVSASVAAFASHLFLDWLGADPTPPHGLQLLWPFSDRWYISGLDLFRGTARRNLFTARSMWINATAIAQEIAITGPVAWMVWRWTSRNRTQRPQRAQRARKVL